MLNINIRINLIHINLTDQFDPYDLRTILTHTQHKCEESAGVILIFSKKCWVHQQECWVHLASAGTKLYYTAN